MLLITCSVQAQDKRGFEIGGQFALLHEGNGLFNFGPTQAFVDPHRERTALGFGGRVVYHINRFWSLELEANAFPEQNRVDLGDIICCANGSVIDGLIIEGLAGTKVGIRKRRVGFFGRVRPGFMRFSNTLGDCTRVSVGTQCSFDRPRTDFALNIGGTAELYITEKWLVRTDLGDIVQRFPGIHRDLPLPFLPSDTEAQFYHNFQFTAGVGYRF
jgi:hypothetical protein